MSILATPAPKPLRTERVGVAQEDLAGVRQTANRLLAQLRQNAPSDTILRRFAPGAFDNPVTRQVVAFTGGAFHDPPEKIREYVVKALRTIMEARSAVNAKCPDPASARGLLVEGMKPDNDPAADGFVLLRINRKALLALRSESDTSGPQLDWIKAKVGRGDRLVSTAALCNHVPFTVIWERNDHAQWMIVAFAVFAN